MSSTSDDLVLEDIIPEGTVPSTPSRSATTSSPCYDIVPKGAVLPFPGNTIITRLPRDTALHRSLRQLCRNLQASPLRVHIGLLNPVDWHTALFEGVRDTARDVPGYWPHDLPIDTPFEQCTEHLSKKLAEFKLGEAAPPYLLTVAGFIWLDVGIVVRLRPRTPEEGARLCRLRDQLSETTGLRMADHDCHNLHLTIGY